MQSWIEGAVKVWLKMVLRCSSQIITQQLQYQICRFCNPKKTRLLWKEAIHIVWQKCRNMIEHNNIFGWEIKIDWTLNYISISGRLFPVWHWFSLCGVENQLRKPPSDCLFGRHWSKDRPEKCTLYIIIISHYNKKTTSNLIFYSP